MNKQSYTYLAIGLGITIVIVLVLGFTLGWFQRGKLKFVEGEGAVDQLPGGGTDESRYISIARSVRDSLQGTTYQSAFFSAAADQLLALNNNELRLTSNIYARDFGDSDAKTLRAIIQNEWLGGTLGIAHPCTQAEKEVVNSNCYKQVQVTNRLNQISA